MIALLRRRPVLSFYVLAFAWTWAYVVVFLILFPLPDVIIRTTPGDLGPLLAALVMWAVVAGGGGVKALLMRLVQWRMSLRWYAFALIAIPLVYTTSIALVPGAAATFTAPSIGALALYPVFYLVLGTIGGPLTEEPGWRGFALPRLQQTWGPLAAALVVGVLWSAWHLPNYFRPDWAAFNGGLSISGIAVFTLAAISLSVIIAWAFNCTGGSLLIAILIHASVNFSQGMTGDLFPAARHNEVAPVLAFTLLALVIVVSTKGRLGAPLRHPGATPAHATLLDSRGAQSAAMPPEGEPLRRV